MSDDASGRGELPAAFLEPGSASFLGFLTRHAPGLLPAHREQPRITSPGAIPHGTTILAARYADGVLMAGDRRVTAGGMIAHREAEKVFRTGAYSVAGISGSVGPAVEMIRLFRLELEHYEKVEGTTLSLAGKASRLTAMIRGNLGMAIQGLGVIPLFAGYDPGAGRGRIFSFDITGAHHEEHGFAVTGSGSPFARGALKKLYRDGLDERDISTVALQALYDAADEDTATGGPDPTRRLYPIITLVTADGVRRLTDDEVASLARPVLEARATHPDGPTAPSL